MTFDGIIGNESVVTALKEMAASGRIPQAMMLYENDGGGAMPLVLAFLDAVYGHDRKVARLIHPDIHYVYPVARGTRVDEKQENLRASLFLDYWRELMVENPYATETEVSAAFGIEGKQAIINNAEAREILETIYLSSVEEPPEKTLFLMITHAPEKVIQTITSRCQAFRVFPLDRTGIVSVLTGRFGASEEDAMQAIAAISDLLGCKNVYDELRLYTVSSSAGLTHYYFQQNYNGVPINSHRTILHVRDESHHIIDLQNSYFSEIELNTVPDISAEDAKKAAEEALPDCTLTELPELTITVKGDTPYLIWNYNGSGDAEIDAHTGRVLYAFNGEIED